MPTTALDTTGRALSHRVEDEKHLLTTQKALRAIAPKQGCFFTQSVVLKQGETTLQLNHDYVFLEFYESLSFKYKQDIAGIILIKNPLIEGEITLSYQYLGQYYEESKQSLVDLINQKDNALLSLPEWINLHQPEFFIPDKSVHQLGRQFGFEFFVFALERLRHTVEYGQSASYDYVINYVDRFMYELNHRVNRYIDQDMKKILDRYRVQFTKDLAGLKDVVNLDKANEAEGRQYALKDYQYQQSAQNKYIITSALMGFKEELYNVFVSMDATGIGHYKGVVATPRLETMYAMTNGTRYVWDTLENVQLSLIPHELKAYPDPTMSDAKWVTYKLSNDVGQRGGIFMGINLKTSDLYIGLLRKTPTGLDDLRWVKQMTQKNADEYIEKLIEHIEDTKNPHQLKKSHVGLSEAPNMAPVTREDIICRKPIRKLVTHDALNLFWKIFMKDIKQLGDEEDPDKEITVAERFRLLFAPCGPCGVDRPIEPKQEKKQLSPRIQPRGKLVAAWCDKYTRMGRFTDGFGGTYEDVIEKNSRDCHYLRLPEIKERGTLLSTYCEGHTLYGKYADGRNSFYVQDIQDNSAICGGTNAPPNGYTPEIKDASLVPIKDMKGTILGYGYNPKETPLDPEATVLLTDPEDGKIAYIFPEEKSLTATGHEATLKIKDIEDNTIGFCIAEL